MGKTSYLSIDGQIVGEHRSGEARSRDYVLDPFGNVTGVYQADWPVAYMSFDPWGERLSGWNDSSYRFAWAGGWGYRQTNLEWSTHYVRARHYSFMDGGWTTVDPLWPAEAAYRYVGGRVPRGVDPTGRFQWRWQLNQGWWEPEPKRFKDAVTKAIMDLAKDPGFEKYLDCIGNDCPQGLKTVLDGSENLIRSWSEGTGKADFVIERDTGGPWSRCDDKTCAWTKITERPPVIVLCRIQYEKSMCGSLKCVIAHELIHATGHAHHNTTAERGEYGGLIAPYECVRLLSGCERFSAMHGSRKKNG